MDRQVLNRRKVNIVLISAFLLFAGCLLYLLAQMGWGIPCVFRLLTKLRCPGCGNTRFVLLALHGDFREALRSNYFCLLEFIYLAWVYISVLKKYYATGKITYVSKYPAMDIMVLIILVLWAVVRNVLGI